MPIPEGAKVSYRVSGITRYGRVHSVLPLLPGETTRRLLVSRDDIATEQREILESAATLVAAPVNPTPPPPPPPSGTEPAPIAGQGFVRVEHDPFDRLDPAKWKHLWYENPDQTASIDNGKLKLVSRRSEGYPNVDLCTFNRYAGGGKVYRFAYLQVKVKWIATKGAWPAIWWFSEANSTHYSGDRPPWTTPLCSEFDIFEGHGSKPEFFPWVLHRNTSSLVAGIQDEVRGYDWAPLPASTAGEEHTLGALWTPTHVSTYFDGKIVSPGPVPVFDSTSQDMYPILSLWMGDGGWGDGNEDASTLNEVPVWYDDFEIWQKPGVGTSREIPGLTAAPPFDEAAAERFRQQLREGRALARAQK